MYLVDTNILSRSDPVKAPWSPDLVRWMEQASPLLFLSAVTASEVSVGIAKARRTGASRKAANLSSWWAAIEGRYGERILPYDLAVARAAGEIFDLARAFAPTFPDVAIAATAQVHGLTVLTANEVHFAPFGVPFLNPLKTLPPQP